MPAKFVRSLGRTLDARPDRLDLRDREFTPAVISLPTAWPDNGTITRLFPKYCKAGLVLDQGEEGACTGFGLACVVNYLFWRRTLAEKKANGTCEIVSARMLYHLARFYDEWSGEDYDGSSCRGALKAWHKHGVCTDTLWPYRDKRGKPRFLKPKPEWSTDALQRRLGVYYRLNRSSVVDMQAAIYEVGAIYVSADVHDGWAVIEKDKPLRSHADLPVIRPMTNEESLGGHAFAIVGFNSTGFIVQNSWGLKWGNCGFAVLPYSDWVQHGTDAWVCALGVPAANSVAAETPVRGKRKANGASPVAGINMAPSLRVKVSPAVAPWSEAKAYQHTVVMGNEGRVINRIVTHENARASIASLVLEQPREALKKRKHKHVLLYAHGGLNSEEASIDRVRGLAPYFEANGIYPVFLTWKTGPTETLKAMLEDAWSKLPRPEAGPREVIDKAKNLAIEALDRTIEVLATPVAKPIWSEMKQNAAAGAEQDAGLSLTAAALAELKAAVPELQIHLAGHSAGSILLGHLLDRLSTDVEIASCHLFAPACTARFAVDHYGGAVKRKVMRGDALSVHILSDALETCDSVGPYRKSLLYLVSRALERCHKMPLIGLEHAFLKESNERWHESERSAAVEWQAFWTSTGNKVEIVNQPQVSTGKLGRSIPATHGCFDNDASTLTKTMQRMLRQDPAHPIELLDF